MLAGLVLISQAFSGTNDSTSNRIRTIGFDAVSIKEVQIRTEERGNQRAIRDPGGMDSWRLFLDEDSAAWAADAARVRTVLRALATASISPSEDDEIVDSAGTLSLMDRDGLTTELRFSSQSTGGFTAVEVVSRGEDGIATDRWFGRIERSMRDSLIGDGLASWRSLDLFPMTIPEVRSAFVRAGSNETTLQRGDRGWRVSSWEIGADPAMVQGMLGLTLGLKATRFFDDAAYTDTLTGLDAPLAQIMISTRASLDSPASIEIGSGVDASGSEVFARYTTPDGSSTIVSVPTEGLNRLTASPVAYVQRQVTGVDKAQIAKLEILDSDDQLLFASSPAAESWVRENGASSVPATPNETDAIERLMQVLTDQESARIYETDPGFADGVSRVGSVVLTLRDGLALRYTAGLESFGGSIRLHLMRGQQQSGTLVWVMSSKEAAGSGAWIAAMGSRSSN